MGVGGRVVNRTSGVGREGGARDWKRERKGKNEVGCWCGIAVVCMHMCVGVLDEKTIVFVKILQNDNSWLCENRSASY